MCGYVFMVVVGYFLIYIPHSNYLCYAVNFLTIGIGDRYWLQRDSLIPGVYSA